MSAEDVQAEISADGNIDFEMLTTWWQQREAEKWTSTMSFFVLFLCANARTPPHACPVHHTLYMTNVPPCGVSVAQAVPGPVKAVF